MSTSTEPRLTILELSPSELEAKKLGRLNLVAALEALHRDGIVALKNAVNPQHLFDKLNGRMVPEAQELYARPTTHRNFGSDTGNIQQEPVLEDGFIFQDIVANPWASEITKNILGPHPVVRFYSANTAFKATARQPVHMDVSFDFPKLPFGYCLNINLVDTSPENGATEVWLGTHTDASQALLDAGSAVRPEVVEARRKISPPIQPSLPKGSLIIRDLRLWHAGRPNQTEEPRVMLVTTQFPQWYQCNSHMVLPKSAKDGIDWGDVVPHAEWFEKDFDYLQGAHDHDFTLLPE
ncbi:hypothetical protein GQ53DRAFT_793602 [Thozetella sp. PMI_491]|nr:hypothetical protein GQ53DRAFT_793602 [Thozetella sp. PMI_491]